MSRGGSKITKNSFDFARGERVSWLDEFANDIEKASKTAVEVARYRNELSLQDQINSIVSRQPHHVTVADLVQEYHERTGLADYLKAQKSNDESDKVAFSLNDDGEAFDGHPLRDKIKNFAKNKIDTSYGQVSVPHIQDELLTQFCSDGLKAADVENEKVAKFISSLISAAQKETASADIGSVDLGKGVGLDLDDDNEANNDFYHNLMPASD